MDSSKTDINSAVEVTFYFRIVLEVGKISQNRIKHLEVLNSPLVIEFLVISWYGILISRSSHLEICCTVVIIAKSVDGWIMFHVVSEELI